LEGKERRCFYHWEENLWINTKNLILLAFKEDHIDFCKQWAHSPTRKEFEMNCARIEAWWNDLGATIPTNVPKFQQLCWWVKKSTHLAYSPYMNLTLKRKLWCQQPISLQMSIHPYGFFMEMDARWEHICTLPLWMTWWSRCCNNNFIICFCLAIKQIQDPLKSLLQNVGVVH